MVLSGLACTLETDRPRCGDVPLSQCPGNLTRAVALGAEGEDELYNGSGFLLHHQLAVLAFEIAIGECECAAFVPTYP